MYRTRKHLISTMIAAAGAVSTALMLSTTASADPVPAVPAKSTLVQERKADDKPADTAKKPAHHDAKVAQKTEKAIVEKKIEHKPEKSKTEKKDKSKPAKPVYFPVGD